MNDTQQATEVWTVPGWDEELPCESEWCATVGGREDHPADYLWKTDCGCSIFVCGDRKVRAFQHRGYVECQRCEALNFNRGTFRPI